MERPGPSEGGFREPSPGRVDGAGDSGGAALTRPPFLLSPCASDGL